jgi:hypothetical protein
MEPTVEDGDRLVVAHLPEVLLGGPEVLLGGPEPLSGGPEPLSGEGALLGRALRLIGWKGVRVGQVIALQDPRDRGRTIVKRVATVSAEGVYVLGDNAGASTDSRHFGVVPLSLVVGPVLYRYHPPQRSGRVR